MFRLDWFDSGRILSTQVGIKRIFQPDGGTTLSDSSTNVYELVAVYYLLKLYVLAETKNPAMRCLSTISHLVVT